MARPPSIGLWPRNDDFDGVAMVSARSRDAKTTSAGSEKFATGGGSRRARSPRWAETAADPVAIPGSKWMKLGQGKVREMRKHAMWVLRDALMVCG